MLIICALSQGAGKAKGEYDGVGMLLNACT